MICHYSQPGQKARLDAELQSIVQLIKQHSPLRPIILGGDFNRNEQAMKVLAETLGLHLNPSHAPTGHTTRQQKRLDKSSQSQIDYFLSSVPGHISTIEQAPESCKFDHNMITAHHYLSVDPSPLQR